MSSTRLPKASVEFTWKSSLEGASSLDAIVNAELDLSSNVELDPSICCDLLQPIDNEADSTERALPCEVLVRTLPSWRIAAFSAVCDARRVEVRGRG